MLSKVWGRLRGHFTEYVSRYAVLAVAVLTPAAGLAGTAAADLGGVNTAIGRALLGVAATLTTGAAGVMFIGRLGIWQMLDSFGTAPGVGTKPSKAPEKKAAE